MFNKHQSNVNRISIFALPPIMTRMTIIKLFTLKLYVIQFPTQQMRIPRTNIFLPTAITLHIVHNGEAFDRTIYLSSYFEISLSAFVKVLSLACVRRCMMYGFNINVVYDMRPKHFYDIKSVIKLKCEQFIDK